ncbi:MAG: Calx-beta domain-containing protein [Candidatus Neomarinimicrobiota bacterium]
MRRSLEMRFFETTLLRLFISLVMTTVVFAQSRVAFESIATAYTGADVQVLAINKPIGTAENDLLIGVIATDASETIFPPSPDWTQIQQHRNGATLGIWWKVAGSSEPGAYTFSWATPEQAVGAVLRYSGADPGDPINGSAITSGREQEPLTPSISSTVDSTMILRLLAADNADLPTPDTSIYPAGTNGRFVLASGTGSGTVTGAVADAFQPSAGATGQAAFYLSGINKFVTATVAIKPRPRIAFAAASSAGVEALDANLSLTLSDPSGATVTVDYAITGGSATGGGVDYTLLGSGILAFLPGSVSETINLDVVDDLRDEIDETVEVTISNPVNAVFDPAGATVHTYTIIDNDNEGPAVAFTTSTSSGDEGTTPANLLLELSAPSDFTVTVDYAATAGTATGAGVDYTLAAGTATFPADQTTFNIPITIVDDIIFETDETIVVTISDPDSATLGAITTHTYTITDNDTPPEIQFALSSSSGDEGTTPAKLLVRLSEVSSQNVSVSYAATGGTATSGDDYALSAAMAIITAGDIDTTIDVTIVNDDLDENDETIAVTLSDPVNATLGATKVHTFTIVDNDTLPVIQFFTSASEGNEAVTPAVFQIKLAPISGREVTVDYIVTGGNATPGGIDYTLAAGTATIPAGATATSFNANIVDDFIDEGLETIAVTLSDPVNAALGVNSVHTYTIYDNDEPPTVQFADSASSGDESISPVALQLVLSAPSAFEITVDYAISGGNAEPTDYVLDPGTVTISSGATSASISLIIIDDLEYELEEDSVQVSISNPVNANLGPNTVHTYTITDNETQPVVQFALTSSSGDEGSSPANLAVQLSSATDNNVTVDYAVTGGTAAGGGVDYTLLPGTATIPAGETAVNIQLAISDDVLDESNETVIVSLSNAVNASLGGNQTHTYTIQDNDPPPTIQFTTAASSGGEEQSPAYLPLELSTVSALNVTVDYSVTGGSATGGGTDYILAVGSATINAGTTTTSICLDVVNDELFESDETIEVTISNPENATLGARTVHTYTIVDDDNAPEVQFVLTSSSGYEGIPSATLQLELSWPSESVVTVNYAVSGGTAKGAGVDYTLVAGTVTIPAREIAAAISFDITDDLLDESDETILVFLSAPVNATLGPNSIHTYTIVDNDARPFIQFATISSTDSEGTNPAFIQLELNTISGQDVTVDYAVTGGTASGDGIDFIFAGGVALIPAGDSTAALSLPIVNDLLDEDDETVVLTLTDPVNANLGINTLHTYTISDDDAPPWIQFTTESSSGDESITSVDLQLEISAISGRNTSVYYAVTGGTVSGGGVDYFLPAGMVTIPAGEFIAHINLLIQDDDVGEHDETLEVTLSNPVNAQLGAKTVYTYTIIDNESPPEVAFTVASGGRAEGALEDSIEVSLTIFSASWDMDVFVNYSVQNISAVGGGVDYVLSSGTAIIPAGQLNTIISVNLNDDALDEEDETFKVTLSNPVNATLGAGTVFTYNIVDDDAPPTIQFSLSASETAEANTMASVQVQLSPVSGRPVSAGYAVSNGTATGGGVDYALVPGTVTIPAGATATTISVGIIDDILNEDDELVELTLSNPVNAMLGADATHLLTIKDYDLLPIVQIAASARGHESDTTAHMPVTLTPVSGREVSVAYRVSGGTATGGGVDYTLNDDILTIPVGATGADILANLINDSIYEIDETIEVTIENPTNANIGAGKVHTFTINDDDAEVTIQFVTTSTLVAENAFPPTLQVQLDSIAGIPVSVDYAVTGGTAIGDNVDYTLNAGTVTIPKGVLTADITFLLHDDSVYEGDETFVVTLSNPSDGMNLGVNAEHTVTIIEDEAPPVLAFNLATSGGDESSSVPIVVTLSSASALPVTFDYAVTGGTATSGVDYALTGSKGTISPGDTSSNIPIIIYGDGLDENDETIILGLSNPVNATLGAVSVHTYTIVNDDLAPSIQFSGTSCSGSEILSPVVLTLNLTNPSGREITVDYSIGGAADSGGVDFTLDAGPIIIPAGASSATLTLWIIDDDLYELSETVVIELTDFTNVKPGVNTIYTYTISDNDYLRRPTIAFTQARSEGAEGLASPGVELALSNRSGADIAVVYNVLDGSAAGDVDFAISGGTVTIPAGDSTTIIPLAIIDDAFDEPDETVLITLASPTNAELGLQKVHTYTILDDDEPPEVSFATASSDGEESVSPVSFGLNLTAPSQRPVSVDYIVSGTATGGGVDYSLCSSTAYFSPGKTAVILKANVFDDPFTEGDETIRIDLANPVNAILGDKSVLIHTILDNDEPPVSFTLGPVSPMGGTIVPGYWNSTNTTLEVQVPVGTALSLDGGNIQLRARIGAWDYESVGSPYFITSRDMGSTKTMILSAAQFEGISHFADGVVATVTAVISDAVGNTVTDSVGSPPLFVDQTPPADFMVGAVVTTGGTSVPLYWNSSNTGLTVTIPIAADTTIIGGMLQLQAEADGFYQNLGASDSIEAIDLVIGRVTVAVAATEDTVRGVKQLSGFSEGDVLTFRALITDVAGNRTVSGVSADRLTVDQTPPQAAITYSDTVAKEGDAVTITATFADADITSPQISIDYAGETISGSLVPTEDPVVWIYTAVIPAGNDGPVTVTIVATDLAGNPLTLENITGRTGLYVDNNPPGYVLAYSDTLARVGDVVTITATFQEPVRPTPTYAVDFAGIGADFAGLQMFRAESDSIWTSLVTIPAGNDGFAAVTVTAYDRIGNLAVPLAGTYSLKVDNTPPVVTSVMPDTGDFVRTAALSYILNERADSGWVTWTWELNPGVIDDASPHVVPLTGDKLNAGTHAGLLPNSPQLVQGAAYTIEISALDQAGNRGFGAIPNVVYDTLAPGIETAIVYDGEGEDIDTSRSTHMLAGHYSGFSEPTSGIVLYEFAVGTTPGAMDVLGWTENGTNTSITVSDLQLEYRTTYYIVVRATDGAGNVSAPVVSDGVIIVAKPQLTTSVVQNNLLSAFGQVLIVDSLGMADSVHLIVDDSLVNLLEVESFTYVATHKFADIGTHSLLVVGFSVAGDTTLTYSLGWALAKRGQTWVASSPDAHFRVVGTAGSVSRDRYLLVVDSTLMAPSTAGGGAYRLGDGQSPFDKPVRVSMRPVMEGLTKGMADQAIYLLRSGGYWEELPTIDDGEMVTTWSESAGTFRLGPRTIIVPTITGLHQNYPNPFNPSTRIVFDLGFNDGPVQRVNVVIYNILGQRVRTLLEGEARMGRYELLWHGIDQQGRSVASGIYFIHLVTDTGYRATKKMLLVR